MLKKPFIISFSAVFLVFVSLLAHAVYQALYNDSQRPRIISCLLFEGDFKELVHQVEAESKYVDRFIILQPISLKQSISLKQLPEEVKNKLKSQYGDQVTFLSLQLSEMKKETFFRSIFLKVEKLNAFKPCQSRDVILFEKQGQRADFKALYQSLSQISNDITQTYEIDCNTGGENEKVQAAAYAALKSSKHSLKSIWTSFKASSGAKRNFFFQTKPRSSSHY